MGPYGPIQIYTEPYGTIRNHIMGPCKKPEPYGPLNKYGNISSEHYIGPYGDHADPYGPT